MDENTRLAIVDPDRCKPQKCGQECRKSCPPQRTGQRVIEIETLKTAGISEQLCIGCGICVKTCPFQAIKIIRLPKNLSNNVIHRYGQNRFQLHNLPVFRRGEILGLIGSNGLGKTTVLKILAGKIKPNLGVLDREMGWDDIIKSFRSENKIYMTKMIENNLVIKFKPQYIDMIPKVISGTVEDVLKKKDDNNQYAKIIKQLDLQNMQTRQVKDLSGGELQRLAIAVTLLQNANIYIFDEPASYLDIKQRIKIASLIKSSRSLDNYIMVVEHDLCILDYISDFICCLYGESGAYGVVTAPFTSKEGINNYLNGFIPTDNLRFRETSLSFNLKQEVEIGYIPEKNYFYSYPNAEYHKDDYSLSVQEGSFKNSEIIILLGENGTGKTTFIKMLMGIIPSPITQNLIFSYKPQMLHSKFEGTVIQLLTKKIGNMIADQCFTTEVIKPLQMTKMYDLQVANLSGGELQKLAICLCLGKSADVYVIDEPSAYLDSELRITVAKMIKRFMINNRKTAFIVEHDFMMALYLADRVIVFDGVPGLKCIGQKPTNLLDGMNSFLRHLGVTFRKDEKSGRPRINKMDSTKDKKQKITGHLFLP